jgi:hypothetical protein
LVGGWVFYEGAGGSLYDLSGNGNSGTFSTAASTLPSWISSGVGFATSYTAANKSYINVSDAVSLAPSNAVTIVALVSFTTLSNDAIFFVKGLGTVLGNASYWLRQGQGGTTDTQFFCNIGGADQLLTVPTAVTTINVLHQIAGVYDGATMKLYVDGQLKGNPLSVSGSLARASGTPLTLGGNPANVLFLSGTLAFAAVYNRALSAIEIAQLAQDPFAKYRPKSSKLIFKALQGIIAASPPILMGQEAF